MKPILTFFLWSALLAHGQNTKFEFVYSERIGDIPDLYISSESLLVKDMVNKPPIKVKIRLSKADRLLIRLKAKQIDFLSYPDEYKFVSAVTTDVYALSTPCSHYNLTIFEGDKSKHVYWNDCNVNGKSKDNRFENLQELQRLICKILYTKKSYIRSKKPSAAYL